MSETSPEELNRMIGEALPQTVHDAMRDKLNLSGDSQDFGRAWEGLLEEERIDLLQDGGLGEEQAFDVLKSVFLIKHPAGAGDALRRDFADAGGGSAAGSMDPDVFDDSMRFVHGAAIRTFDSDEEREEFEQQKARALEKLKQDLEEAYGDDAKDKKNKDTKPKADSDPSGERETYNVGWWNKMIDQNRFKITDMGDYMKFKPDQKKMDDQIRIILLRAIYEKGAKEIRFYKNGQIDHGISSQAGITLSKMKAEKMIPEDVQVISDRMNGPEPWLGIYGRATRSWRNQKFDNNNDRIRRAMYGEGKKIGDLFKAGTAGLDQRTTGKEMARYGIKPEKVRMAEREARAKRDVAAAEGGGDKAQAGGGDSPQNVTPA